MGEEFWVGMDGEARMPAAAWPTVAEGIASGAVAGLIKLSPFGDQRLAGDAGGCIGPRSAATGHIYRVLRDP